MSALFPTPLTAPRERVGFVDGSRDSERATARTLEQLQGHQRSSTAQIVPMDEPARMHRSERLVTAASACAGLFVLGLLAAERWFA